MAHTPERGFIRHVVFFSAKDKQDVDRIMAGLGMLQNVPGARHFEVRKNLRADRFSDDVDIVLYSEFDDEDALKAYHAHPIYQECIAVVRPLRDLRIAADF